MEYVKAEETREMMIKGIERKMDEILEKIRMEHDKCIRQELILDHGELSCIVFDMEREGERRIERILSNHIDYVDPITRILNEE